MLQGNKDEATQLLVRAAELRSGPDHLEVAAALYNRAVWLIKQVRAFIKVPGKCNGICTGHDDRLGLLRKCS